MRDAFDRVVCINLRRRQDRWVSFQAQLAEHGWPFREVERFDAVDGNKVGVPVGWTQGGGTWGCLMSHRIVLQQAMMDDVGSLLVLEDDLCMRTLDEAEGGLTFAEQCERFLATVPSDWDQLMLGGQHLDPPLAIKLLPSGKPCVVRCNNCQRTHAYAIRGRMLRDLYQTWCSHTSVTHCDHIMGPMHRRYNVYAPHPFIFGQDRSTSDISGSRNPKKFWQPPRGDEPVLLLRCPSNVVSALRDYGVHTGYTRDARTDVDRGLMAALEPYNEGKLRKWVNDLQWECRSEEGSVLGVWHPAATAEMLQRVWTGPTRTIEAATLGEALAQINAEGSVAQKRLLPARQYVIVLTAPKSVVGQLRSLGWHTGNWRDPITDVDNGLRAWWESRDDDQLAQVVKTLASEAESIKGGVACVWHPEATPEVVESVTDLTVVAITADSAESALAQWEAAKHSEGSKAG